MSKLYELPKATLQDIPHVLRSIAKEMEDGNYGKTHMAVVVIEDETGNVRTFGAGGADYYRGLALLQLGIENMVAKRGREYML